MSVAVAGLVGALVFVVGAAPGAPHGRAGRADLRVRSLSNPPASVERGAQFTSTLRVANLGMRTARRSTVRGYLSRDSRKSSGDAPLPPARSVAPLKPGKATRRTVIARVPRGTSTGQWFLIACADAARIVRETNERNNCRTSARRTAVTAGGSPPFSPPAPLPPPPPPNEPPPIAGQGYHQAFADTFDTFDAASWTNRAFWDGAPPANAVYAQDGVLHLVSRRSQGYENITVSSHGKRNFRQGYFEARMRWTKGPGAWPAFWLSSTYHYTTAQCPYFNAELDVFEGQGTEPTVFYGALHRNTNGVCGVPDESNDSNTWQPQPFDLTAGFHVYAAKWTATEVIWYLDNEELMRWPAYAGSTDQNMYIMFDMWIGGWTSDTNPSTPDELQTEVDWVRVWQK
jgi:hypothetical protein